MARDVGVVTALLAGTCGLASGQTTAPQFYSWSAVNPASTSQFMEMVRVPVHTGSYQAAADAADRVCSLIVSRGLNVSGAQIAILLEGFGMGATKLAFHASDAVSIPGGDAWTGVPNGESPPPGLTRQPWMAQGIVATGAWMDAFITKYEANQAFNSTIPDPVRFHFDFEHIPTGCCSASYVDLFEWAVADTRWDTAPVPGFGGTATAQDIFEAEYVAFGLLGVNSLTKDPLDAITAGGTSFGTTQNQKWQTWWRHVANQAVEGALEQAAYLKVRAAFPGCKTSNFDTSAESDGGDGGKRVQPDAYPPGETWYKPWWERSANLMSPILYAVDSYHAATKPCNGTETQWEASLRIARQKLEACIFSTGGSKADMAPWVALTGTPTVPTYSQSVRECRDMMELLRAFDVPEVLLFSNTATQTTWDDFKRAYDLVYTPRLTGYAVDRGTETTTHATSLLHFILNDPAVVTTDARNEAAVHATFGNLSSSYDSLKINVESTMNRTSGQRGVVLIRRAGTNDWDRVGTLAFCNKRQTFYVGGASNYITSGGVVEVKVFHAASGSTSPTFESKFDLVQLVQGNVADFPVTPPTLSAECHADYNHDGVIDSTDSTDFYDDFINNRSGADLNEDGDVADDDAELFGESCS